MTVQGGTIEFITIKNINKVNSLDIFLFLFIIIITKIRNHLLTNSTPDYQRKILVAEREVMIPLATIL